MTKTCIPFAFGAWVRVYAVTIRVSRPAGGTLYQLRDRRHPGTGRGRIVLGPDDGWPGEPIADGVPAGYDLGPPAGTGAVRLCRLPLYPGSRTGLVVGSAIRYEGTYHPPGRGRAGDDHEPGVLADRRPVRLVEVALAPPPEAPAGSPAEVVLAWREDFAVLEPGADRAAEAAGTAASSPPAADAWASAGGVHRAVSLADGAPAFPPPAPEPVSATGVPGPATAPVPPADRPPHDPRDVHQAQILLATGGGFDRAELRRTVRGYQA